MKQSGIDWIGEIPDDWKINQLSQIVSQVKNKNTGLKENNLLSLSYGKIKRKNINTNDGLLPASFDGYNIITDGDIVLRLTDLQNDHTSLRVGRATEQGIITSAYTTLHPVDYDNSKYLYYILHSFDLKKGFYGMGSGVRQGLNYDEVKTLKVPLPPKATQQRIAEYLDKKVSEIDSIIEESKKSIEEYKGWKQSVIFEAVTGKNLNCKKKDSGIEWIGEIPENYKLIRLKFLLKEKLQYGANSSGIEFSLDLPRYIRITDIKDSKTLYDENKLSLSEEDAKDYILDDNDILFARSGATSGKCFIYKKEIGKATFAGYLIRAKIDETKLLPNFLVLYTMTKAYEEWKNQVCIQATIQNISAEKYVNLIVPVPPLPEQESIAKMLDSKCAQIDSLITEKESLIADLTEYKKSLIFEVVTGKRSV